MLALAVTTYLYPLLSPESHGAGELTKIRAQAVSGGACRRVAEELGVPERMRTVVPDGFADTIETLTVTERVLASVIEAVIGACYLTFGYDRTAAAVVEAFKPEIEHALEHPGDFKSALQERLAQSGRVVTYLVKREVGPPHDRIFDVAAVVDDEEIGEGSGRSKKIAEQAAAEAALEVIK